MSKDPAFLFYPGDFLTGTHFFNNEEVGSYVRLLCHQFENDFITKEEIDHICSEKVWLKISKKFTQKNGKYFNDRLRLEKDKRVNYSKSRSNNRKNPNKDKVSYEKDMKDISKTYVPHMENENEDENISKNKDVIIKEENHSLQNYILENCPNIQIIKTQLTYDNCEALLEKFKNKALLDTILQLENFAGIKKYKSVFLTLNNWCGKDKGNTNSKKSLAERWS